MSLVDKIVEVLEGQCPYVTLPRIHATVHKFLPYGLEDLQLPNRWCKGQPMFREDFEVLRKKAIEEQTTVDHATIPMSSAETARLLQFTDDLLTVLAHLSEQGIIVEGSWHQLEPGQGRDYGCWTLAEPSTESTRWEMLPQDSVGNPVHWEDEVWTVYWSRGTKLVSMARTPHNPRHILVEPAINTRLYQKEGGRMTGEIGIFLKKQDALSCLEAPLED